MSFDTLVMGAIRRTLTGGVAVMMVLGLIIPGLSLISLIMVFAKPSQNARETKKAMEAVTAPEHSQAIADAVAKAVAEALAKRDGAAA
jgi:hypothetical protein